MRAQEFVKPHQMAKLEKTGRIVEILRHQDQVDFSDEPGWYLINLEPGKRVAPDMKWIPDSTRFEWVREFKRANAVVEDSFDGIDVTMERDADEITVRAAAGGKQLGHVLFVQDGDALLPQDLEVDERYQGQGIAKVMYDYVKSLGYQIRRSGQQTAAGAGFWGKHRPAQNVWEQDVVEDITPNTIHKLADRTGVKWDNEPNFLQLTKRLTGKEHLDDLNQTELHKVKQHLEKQGVAENFADGKGPGRPGDSARHGIPKGATIAQLEKAAKAPGRKGQLARWQLNMRRGKKK